MLQMLQVDRTNQLAAAGHLQRLEQERLGQNHRRAASIELESKVKGLGPMFLLCGKSFTKVCRIFVKNPAYGRH